MELSLDQTAAYDAVFAWLADPDGKPWYYLTGPAGTGKTTLAKHIADAYQNPVRALAYTGKAASVLTRKGLPAATIHSTIYLPSSERTAEIEQLERDLDAEADHTARRKLIRRLEALNSPSFVVRPMSPFRPGTLIICDEVSMVSETEAKDLLSFGCRVLVLGDDAQLPPVQGPGYFAGKPDFRLTEIHRQALESPVLRLATLAREGRSLPSGAHGSSLVTTRKAITRELAVSCSQLICGSNKARKELNGDMRRFLGYSGEIPLQGEKLICLRNNPRESLLNGQIIELSQDSLTLKSGYIKIHSTEGHACLAHAECFSDADVVKAWNYERRKRANEFDWGYCITAHKSQGSEWDSVLVWADQFRWDREMFQKWLYTAITRASERAIIAL